LGARGTAFRVKREVAEKLSRQTPDFPDTSAIATLPTSLALPSAAQAGKFVAHSLSSERQASLAARATAAEAGEIRMFSAWAAAAGSPPEWSIDPVSGNAWKTPEFRGKAEDIKFVW